jgi:hypothetical protein
MFMQRSRKLGFIADNATMLGNEEWCRNETSPHHALCEEWPLCNLTAFYAGQVGWTVTIFVVSYV